MPLQNQPFMQPVNGAGKPYPGALAYYFVSGTATPAEVYGDGDLATAHAHPVVADAAGVFPDIYTDPAITYRLQITTASGALVADIDPISGGSAIGSADLSDGAVTQVKIADGAVSAAKLAAQSVGNSAMASMPAATVKGNASGATAIPADITAVQLWDLIVRPVVRGQIYAAGHDVAGDDYYGLICDGREMSRSATASAPLFAKIGTRWGNGDGSTTFNLPDLRGYGLVGIMGTRGLDDPLSVVGASHADQMQTITGTFGNVTPSTANGANPVGTGAFTAGGASHATYSGAGASNFEVAFDSSDSPGARAGLTTHGREAGVVFMIHY